MLAPALKIDVLEDVLKTLEPETAWTQLTLAREPNGDPCNPNLPEACCWCLTGAVDVSASRVDVANRLALANAVKVELSTTAGIIDDPAHYASWRITDWNDAAGRTKEQVLELVRETIGVLKQEA